MLAFNKFRPPVSWIFPVTVVVGILVGLLIYLLYISNAYSYASDKPETCVNCHIMGPQYATWSHSSHRERAHCNDCHVPHNNIVNKYFFKGKDGLRHATIFTLRLEPQVIFIKEAGKEVVQDNCKRCHFDLLFTSKSFDEDSETAHSRGDRLCWECHREVPHGRVNSLSSVPFARVPTPESPVPEIIRNLIK